MANFIVSFKLKADRSYNARYDSVIKTIHEISNGYQWGETSSFFTFEADETAESLCKYLWSESLFTASKDRMLVVDMTNRKKAIKGAFELPGLLSKGLGF